MGFAKMLLQLFADESETTDSEEVEETIDEEYDDGTPTDETTEETQDEEEVVEPEKAKSFKEILKEHPEYQEEMNSMMEDRVIRERKKMDRKYKDELSKYEELAYLTQKGLEAEDFDDALNKTREFYDTKGIKYSPKANSKDNEILANAYAQEIINDCDSIDDLEDAIKTISKKGDKISERDALIIKGLNSEITSRKRFAELSSLGVSEEVYNSKEFKDFESKFSKETSISDIYEIYNTTLKAEKHIQNPGSMKSVPSTEKKDFISEKEYDRMTDKEIEENMELIRNSMSKW